MIMENILLTVQNQSFLLSTIDERTLSQVKKISEVDKLFKVWSPIINELLNVNKRLCPKRTFDQIASNQGNLDNSQNSTKLLNLITAESQEVSRINAFLSNNYIEGGLVITSISDT